MWCTVCEEHATSGARGIEGELLFDVARIHRACGTGRMADENVRFSIRGVSSSE